jgi:hypothetical protein
VANLVKALIRAGRFLAPIVVFAEAANHYRLIAGGNRLVAWKRCFSEQRPIPAITARRADHRPQDRGELAPQGADCSRAPG